MKEIEKVIFGFCPKCNEPHNDSEEGYQVDSIKYPIHKNERDWDLLKTNYYEWDEHHKCQNCKTEYWFVNGIF